MAREANRYLDGKAPWFQIKQDRQAAATTVYVTLRVIDSLKTLLLPLPALLVAGAARACSASPATCFGAAVRRRHSPRRRAGTRRCATTPPAGGDRWQPEALPVGQALGEPAPLFRKLDDSIAAEEVERMLERSR